MKPQGIYNFFSQFNLALIGKKQSFYTPYYREVYILLECLRRNKLIYGFKIDTVNPLAIRLIVFPIYYLHYPLIRHLSVYSQTKIFRALSFVELQKSYRWKHFHLQPLVILRNAFGFTTVYESLSLGQGGYLSCVLFF